MSALTDAASRFGQIAGAGDARAQFLREFGGLIINTYDEIMDYQDLHWVKQINQGKSDTFPIIGRKRDGAEHTPGEEIIGGTIVGNEIEITVDNVIFDSVFVASIDEMLAHFSVREPYARQLGQSLASLDARRIAIMHILASRKYYVGNTPTNVPQGQPAPGYAYDAAMKTSASVIETAFTAGRQYLLENEISGAVPVGKVPWAQYLLLARNFGVEDFKPEAGSGSRVTGKVGMMMGFSIEGSNHIPSTNITTGNSKYQGNFSTTMGHISSKMAVGTLERMAMKLTVKEQEERLGVLMIASKLNGHGILRPECSYELATAVRS